MKRRRNSKHRTIEIYFVLYLAALILLLPSNIHQKRTIERNAPIFQFPFSLRAEKPALYCKMRMNAGSPELVSLDSINTIFYTVGVRDVRLEFSIKDATGKLTHKNNEQSSSKYFKLRDNKEQNSAKFFWKPPLYELVSKSYMVKVSATAKPGNNEKNENETQARTFYAEVQFSLNVIFENEIAKTDNNLAPDFSSKTDSIIKSLVARQNSISQLEQTDIFLKPDKENISAIPLQRWENQIFITGINLSDLYKFTKLEIIRSAKNNRGSAGIKDIQSNKISIYGVAPLNGSIKVIVSATRKRDNKRVGVDFYVNTIILPAADYPKEMYPEITYEIAPNLPLEIGQKIYSVLKDEQKARAVSQQGENFKFTPDISDTGKTLVLERYINDNLTGQSYYLKVKSFPPPEIIRYSLKEENTIRVETRSYGFHDGKENLVAEIILQGNAKSREIFGKIQRDQNKFIYIQEFEISRKNQSQPFILKFLAIDRRGIKSEEKQFP